LVRGHRVAYVEGDENVGDIRPFGFLTKLAVAGAGVLLALLLLWLYARWRKSRGPKSADAVVSLDEPEQGDSSDELEEPEQGDSSDELEERISRARHRA
jgi:hypothetical protein